MPLIDYSLIGPPAVATRVLWIRFVRPVQKFFGIGSFVFSGTQHGVVACCVAHDRAEFFAYIFAPKIEKMGQT